jgi:protein O-mannosyl-transferase
METINIAYFRPSQMAKKTSKSSEKHPVAVKSGPVTAAGAKTGVKKQGFLQRSKFYVILFCLTFVVFGNSIYNEYALDDEFYTAGSNKLTQQGIKGIPEIFKTRTFFNNDGSGYSYRPVALTSFALEIQLFGEKARTSHFINVLLYAFTMILLFSILKKWFVKQGHWFAFFVTLLFLVHPIHTEVVANIKCRDELLAFFFVLVTIRLVWLHFETGRAWLWPLISVSFLLAVLSKTSIAAFFLLTPISVWYFTDAGWKKSALYLVPMIVAFLFVKFVLLSRIPEMSRTLQGFENPVGSMPYSQQSATAAYVMGRYLYLMFIPFPLIFYYGLNEVPVCTWSNPIVILSLIVNLALIGWMVVELKKKSIIGFGILLYGANLILFSNLLAPAPGIMAERFAYSASLGFIIVVVALLFRFTKLDPAGFVWKSPNSAMVRNIVLVVVFLFGLRSIIRNEAWQDKETLYRNDVELAPESAKINMLLASFLSSKGAQLSFQSQRHMQQAQQLMQRGQQQAAAIQQDSARMIREESYATFREARQFYLQATTVFPDYYTAWSNLGTAYYFTHEYREGIPFFKRAIEIKPDYAEAYFNLGMSYEQLARTKTDTNLALLDSSFYYFEEGLRQDSSYVNSAEQLSRMIFTYRRDSAMALHILNKAAENNPKSDVPWNAMSSIFFQSKDTASGLLALETAARLNPDNFNRLGNLANYYYSKGNNQKATYYKELYDQKVAEYQRQQKLLGKNRR